MEQLKAILVDDELPSLQNLEQKLIEFCPDIHIIASAQKPEDAIQLIEQMHPDVVFLDIEMPRMDGYELAAALQRSEEFSSIPVVMITSRSAEKHRDKAFESGVTKYLTKPYDDKELLETIRTLANIT